MIQPSPMASVVTPPQVAAGVMGEVHSLPTTWGGGICMAGYVRSNEKCPVCRQPYKEELSGRLIVLICPEHRTMPRRYYVDTSGFGLKTRKRYSDKNHVPFASREAASQFLDSMRAAKGNRATWDPKEWDEVDIRDFKFPVAWKKWVESKESDWSPGYFRQVEWIRSKIVAPRWETLDVRDIRNAHLIDLKTSVAKDGYAPSVVKLVIGVTCSFLSGLRIRGDIKEVLTRPTVRVPSRDLFILDADQQTAIIACAKPRYRQILTLAARCGVRPCEVCAVRVMDIVGGYIHFQRSMDDFGNLSDTKTGTVNRKPIPSDMAREIAVAMRFRRPEAPLFTNRSGKPFRPGVLSRVWKMAAIAAGLKGSTLNVGTRHSFATRTWRAEESEARKRTADMVGHAGPGTTFKHYVREEG